MTCCAIVGLASVDARIAAAARIPDRVIGCTSLQGAHTLSARIDDRSGAGLFRVESNRCDAGDRKAKPFDFGCAISRQMWSSGSSSFEGSGKFMQARDIDYRCDAVNLRGYLALDENATGPRPGVLVFHEGLGLGEFAMERARRLAGLGYVALAADMSAIGGRRPICRRSRPWSAGFAPSRKNSAPAAVPRSRRSPRCRRSMPAGWRRSGSALAGRWCWSWRARAPSSRRWSVSTAC